MNRQWLEARELERGDEQKSVNRLKVHSMVETKRAVAETKRKKKIESKRESLCTLVDLRISSKSLLFCHVVLRLDLSSHL